MMTDTLADMLTRIRNANRIERPAVDMPATRLKRGVAQVLKEEGFILDYEVGESFTDEQGHASFRTNSEAIGAKAVLRVFLKYGPEGEKVIRHISRASKPGLRIYRGHQELPPVLDGLGISILSTSRGVMSDRRARAERVGGELLCRVW
jgi:small subunit ribosomal protein S8